MLDSSRNSGPVAWNAKTNNHLMCETTGLTRHLPYLYLMQPFKPSIRILTGTFLQCTHSCLIEALFNSCPLSSCLWTIVKSFLKTHHSDVHEMHSSISHDKGPRVSLVSNIFLEPHRVLSTAGKKIFLISMTCLSHFTYSTSNLLTE